MLHVLHEAIDWVELRWNRCVRRGLILFQQIWRSVRVQTIFLDQDLAKDILSIADLLIELIEFAFSVGFHLLDIIFHHHFLLILV